MVSGRALRRGLAGLLTSALIAATSCTLITDSFLTNDFSGDPFPVSVDTSTGAIVVGMRQDGEAARIAVLDLLSPLTVIDQSPTEIPSLTYAGVTLLGMRGPDQFDLPRARFPGAQLVGLHPCADDCNAGDPDCDPEPCRVGTAGALRDFQSVIGADMLAGDAVRLRLGDEQLFVLPDVGGPDRDRTLACEAVFSSPYRGGGTLVIAGTELAFGNRRITVQACLGHEPDPPLDLTPDPANGELPRYVTALTGTIGKGTDALLVVSTSIGISILGEAVYRRYQASHDGAPAVEDLPRDMVYLPSGPVFGGRATISRLALVAAPTTNALAPCRQVYAHRLLTAHRIGDITIDCANRGQLPAPGKIDCPCENDDPFCPVPAVLELSPAQSPIDVLVVADTDPTLQALRTELRPDQPELDGVLGTNALRTAELDVDYPHDRLLARCAGDGCVTRPQLATICDRTAINRCIYGTEVPLDCP